MIFLAVVLLFLMGLLLMNGFQGSGRKKSSVLYYLLAAAILGLFILVDFTAAWLIVLITLILFLAVVLWKRMFRENVNKLLLPILLIIVAGVFTFADFSIVQLPKESLLNQQTSWNIAFESATDNVKNGFLGSGIGTFRYDFSKFKQVDFNQSSLWQLRFNQSGNHIAELLGTTGFLGILSYLWLFVFALLISWLFFLQDKKVLSFLRFF